MGRLSSTAGGRRKSKDTKDTKDRERRTEKDGPGDSKSEENFFREQLEEGVRKFHDRYEKPQEHRHTQPGSKLEDFDLKRTIGTGTYGHVHIVKCKKNKHIYAMKVLEKAKVVQMKQEEHTMNEKKILEAADSPFIVKLVAAFKDNANLFMVMEFLAGGEVFKLLRAKKAFNEVEGRFISAQVILAFEYLHSLDIVYRDLKPENILFTTTGYIKLADFGFAKILKANGRAYTICGTPDYLSPEMIQNKGYGTAVDWWAFGILVFELCAGIPPFYANEIMKIYDKILASQVHFPPDFSQDLRHLLRNVLQKDVTKRYGHLKGGVKDIKYHKWYSEVDWRCLVRQMYESPLAAKVKVKGQDDAHNFDSYEEKPVATADEPLYDQEFADF